MPRLKQYAEKYAREDFLKEIRRQQGEYNLMTGRELARAMGIPHTSLRDKILEPDKMNAEFIRNLVGTLDISPEVLLAFLGYDKKQINQWICRQLASKEEPSKVQAFA